MPDILRESVFGVQVGLILLGFVRLFKSKLDLFEFLGIAGTTWAVAAVAGVLGGLINYADWIAANWPAAVSAIQVGGAVLVPFLLALGFWDSFTSSVKSFSSRWF